MHQSLSHHRLHGRLLEGGSMSNMLPHTCPPPPPRTLRQTKLLAPDVAPVRPQRLLVPGHPHGEPPAQIADAVSCETEWQAGRVSVQKQSHAALPQHTLPVKICHGGEEADMMVGGASGARLVGVVVVVELRAGAVERVKDVVLVGAVAARELRKRVLLHPRTALTRTRKRMGDEFGH